MGFAAVAQASGSANRSEAELNLLKKENQNRLRVDNTVATARGSELDARAGEAAESTRKFIDTFFQVEGAKKAEDAAEYGFWGAIANGVTKLASNIIGGTSIFGIISDTIGDAFAALGAYFALMGAQDEVELLKTQFGELSEGTKGDQEMVRALDGNPAL